MIPKNLKIPALVVISSSLIIMFTLSTKILPQSEFKSYPENRLSLPGHPPYGGTLLWGTTNPPTIINPILTQHSVSASLMGLLFDSLVRIDSQGNIVPGLARTWTVSPDGREYTFYLKKGIYFHDGIECTAEDVKFTYETIGNPKNQSPWKTNTELVSQWEVIDRYTFKVTLPESSIPLLNNLVREIAPKHILKNQDLASTSFNFHPVGTGPFKFKEWDLETNQIELEANPDYFEGRPYLDRIIVKSYPDNSSLWAALMRHEVDFVQFINSEDYSVLENDPTYKIYKINSGAYCAIDYNLKAPILADIEVRKAIVYGIDIKKLMAAVSGDGIVSTGPFHPESQGFNADIKPLAYNPLKAKITLMHQGWRDVDGDGILEKGGQPLEIRLLVDAKRDYYKRMAMEIRQQLSEIGIKIKILLYENENELTAEYISVDKPQAWLRFFQGLGNDMNEAVGSWYSLSSQFGKLWNYKNKEVDLLFESARTTQDQKEKIRRYQSLHKMIYEKQPACFLFFPASFCAISARFENTDAFFCRHMPNYVIKDWYMLRDGSNVKRR